jgi:hypothetical protein
MTNQVGKTCEFIHDINKSIPTDNELTSAISSCTIGEAETDFSLFKVTGSCYGEVEIDYNKKTMKIYLTHVSSAQTFSSPYDDMLGFLKGIKSVVQYKINGNLETDKIQMTTRIQCVTNDNCALDKLRALISNLTISDTRKNIFKELKNFLNPSESNPSSQLTYKHSKIKLQFLFFIFFIRCMDNDDDQVDCQDDQNRCKFDLKKTGMEKSCTTADSDGEFDLEYRFNLIQEISDIGIDNSAKSFKCTYLCKTDLCNSEDNFMKVSLKY